MSNEKTLYKGTFNWHGETLIIYNYANSKKQSLAFMIITLSNRLGYERSYISNYFHDESVDNYKIEKVKNNV